MERRVDRIGQDRLAGLRFLERFIELAGAQETAGAQLVDAIGHDHQGVALNEVGVAAEDGQHGHFLQIGRLEKVLRVQTLFHDLQQGLAAGQRGGLTQRENQRTLTAGFLGKAAFHQLGRE